MQLTEHFSLSEFTATDYALSNLPSEIELERIKRMATVMEEVRQVLGHPVIITSGFRSDAVNRAAGGADNSSHRLGLAVDFKCPGYGTPLQICMAIIDAGIRFDQMIDEYKRRADGSISNWVHLGIGPKSRQQVLTRQLDGQYTVGVNHG